MQFITALQDTQFFNPVYGAGDLKKGKTYYTFSQFARETIDRGLARPLDRAPIPITRFMPTHLDGPDRPRRVLLMFAGGLGDAITVGIVLPAAMARHNLHFDICCDPKKWEGIFQPMALPGRPIPFPPDLDILSGYEAVLCDISDFFPIKEGLKVSPVMQLMQGFHIHDPLIRVAYRIPAEIRQRMLLPATDRKRIGLNLDSNGRIKSYPLKLYEALFSTLRSLDLDLHLFGNKSLTPDLSNGDGLFDWRGKTGIPELAALLAQMDIVLGVDSFIVHLADLLEKTSLVLLGTTAPTYFDWHRHIACLQSGLDCSPCFAFADQCPKGYAACKAFEQPGIRPDVIAQTVHSLLYKRPL